MFNYDSGIGVHPLMSGGGYQQAMQGYQRQPTAMPMSMFPQQQYGAPVHQYLNSMLGGLSRINNQQAGLNFARQYATQNAGHMLDAETARAQSGLGGYGYMNDQQGQQMNQQSQLRQMMMQMFGQYFGG